MVWLTGAVRNSSAISGSNDERQMFSVPSGWRPAFDVRAVCQGSGNNKYLLHVTTGGAASMSRYGTTSNATCGAGSWLVLNAAWALP